MNGTKIITLFESVYPKHLAYDWDNVGLQIGTLNKDIKKILLTLDVTKEVVDEAIHHNCNLIIAHHPLIFQPIKQVDTTTYQGQIIESMIKHDITLYVAHTNFDISNHGMDFMLASMLQLENLENLDELTDNEGLGKIGTIPEMTMEKAIKHVKRVFGVTNARFIGDLRHNVSTIAISGGSGSYNMFNAASKKADLFITGDVTYHKALDSRALGINTLDVGHYIEKHFITHLKKMMEKEGIDVEIIPSAIETNPYQFV